MAHVLASLAACVARPLAMKASATWRLRDKALTVLVVAFLGGVALAHLYVGIVTLGQEWVELTWWLQ